MFLALLKNCEITATCGGAPSASTSPVWSAVAISVEGSGTGLKPADRQISTASASPAQEKSLSLRRSSGTATGFFAKKWTQPPSAQLRTTKPFASRLASSFGRIFSWTQYTSS